MGKLEDNKKIKREAILDAAFLLFTTKGLTKTSVADITAAAGVAKGTFYLYFKDKYDLRDKLIVHKSNEIFQRAYFTRRSLPLIREPMRGCLRLQWQKRSPKI